jgi:hypothetical protein
LSEPSTAAPWEANRKRIGAVNQQLTSGGMLNANHEEFRYWDLLLATSSVELAAPSRKSGRSEVVGVREFGKGKGTRKRGLFSPRLNLQMYIDDELLILGFFGGR